MQVVMDADCLIKLTKAGLKEKVCATWKVVIPAVVRRETVEVAPHLPDALLIGENIRENRLAVHDTGITGKKGEEAALFIYRSGGFDAVATDDRRFIRRLRVLGVPYALPAVIVVRLYMDGVLTLDHATEAVEELRPHISADQYAAARLMLTGGTRK